MLNMSVRTLRALTERGDIRAVLVGARRKYVLKDIKEYRQPILLAQLRPDGPLRIFDPDWGYVLSRTRSRAKQREMTHKLTKEDLAYFVERCGGRCEVSGIPFSRETIGDREPYAPSIDRIDSSLGYIRDNCRLVCYAVNLALSNWGDDVLIRIAYGIVRQDLTPNNDRTEE